MKKIAYHQVSQEYLAIDFTRWFPHTNILQGDLRCKILVNTKAEKENTTKIPPSIAAQPASMAPAALATS